MSIVSLLESRLAERRRYVAGFDLRGHLGGYLDHFRTRHGDGLEATELRPLEDCVEIADFCVRGEGGHAALAGKLRLELPADFLAFSSAFSMYAIVARNGIEICDAEAVEEITLGLRDGEEIAGDFAPHPEIGPDTPHRLYRFAQVFGLPFHFIFRWNEDGTFRDVAFACHEETREGDLLGEGSEFFSCDGSFTEWLERMFATDASPLHAPFDRPDGHHGPAHEIHRVREG